MRTVAAGLSRVSPSVPCSSSISSRRGPIAFRSRWPASVGETLRVVRVGRRIPRRVSSARIAWLGAERDNLDWPGREIATLGMLAALPGAVG